MDKVLPSAPPLMECLIQENLSSIKSNCRLVSFQFHIEYELLLGDVLEKVWTYRDKYSHKNNKSFLNWVGFIVKNAAIDIYRKKKKKQTEELNEGVIVRPSNQNLENSDYLKHINAYLLGRFGEVKHLMVVMRAKGWKFKEISEHLGIPEGAIKSIIFRIKKDLSQKEKQTNRNLTKRTSYEKNKIFTKNQVS